MRTFAAGRGQAAVVRIGQANDGLARLEVRVGLDVGDRVDFAKGISCSFRRDAISSKSRATNQQLSSSSSAGMFATRAGLVKNRESLIQSGRRLRP